MREFGPRFARYTDGHDRDAASAFLLPPFQPAAVDGALSAWRAWADEMARPGDAKTSRTWLTWIDKHRTPSGAIPEKVPADGSPTAAAPLAWSAACVVLAAARLDQGL